MAAEPAPLQPTAEEARDAKFRELILYIVSRHEADRDFGTARLYKTLFYADFGAYVLIGRPITGRDYIKMPHGPMPDRVAEVIEKLVRNGDAAIERRNRDGFVQKRMIALRDPHLDLFSAREIALVDRVIEELRGIEATRDSDIAHRFIGWQLARDGEVIPYNSSWVVPRKLTPEEIAYGLQLAANG